MIDGFHTDVSHETLMTNRWISQTVLIVLMVCCKVMCTGVFEVSLLKLNNNRGVTHNGRCCGGTATSPPCSGECKTFITVCLLHYTQSMPSPRHCTYGQLVTSVIGGNNILGSDEFDDMIIQMPINHSWPGAFTLIVEAWHDTDGKQNIYDANQLIIQNFRPTQVAPGVTWYYDTSTSPTTEMKIKYRVVCDQHYYTARCDKLCKPRDDQYGHYSCDDNGIMVCNHGWMGDYCEQPMCSSECLKNKGICERPFECRCRLGWQGRNCGECRPFDGCLHGYCHQPYQCICENGWAGQQCDVDTQYCAKSKPCLHGGTCTSDSLGNYTCLCPPGFGGNNCQHPLCYTDFCHNGGTCQTRNGARECLCREDNYGMRCEHIRMSCDELNCQNGGRCKTGENGGACHCAEGYTGTTCEMKIDPCTSSPCHHGAECRQNDSRAAGFQCLCPYGFGGDTCTIPIDPCSGVTCYHGGQCVFKSSRKKPYCACLSGYYGEFCEIVADPCKGVTCLNSGTCKVSPNGNGFICYCAKGYHGEVCELKMNPCKSSPCQNGGVCKNYISTFLCICNRGFSGKHCEHKKLESTLIPATQNDNVGHDYDGSSAIDREVKPVTSGSSNVNASFIVTLTLVLSVVSKAV